MRHLRLPLFLGLAFGLSVALMQCGPSRTCDVKTCPTGCCDANNQCQTGTQVSACGTGAVQCAACPTGQSCVQQVCGIGGTGGGSGGGSGGGTGGGTAGGAGGGTGGGSAADAGCRVITTLSENVADIGYDNSDPNFDFNFAYQEPMSSNPDAGNYDLLITELYWFNGLTIPVSENLAPTTVRDCDLCFYFDEDCNPTSGNCARSYLAQAGSFSATQATKDPAAGRFAASGTNIRFVEWDFSANDRAVPGGRCIIVNNYDFDDTWDAGLPMTDGGTNDAGTSDAGTDTDAGTTDGGDGG